MRPAKLLESLSLVEFCAKRFSPEPTSGICPAHESLPKQNGLLKKSPHQLIRLKLVSNDEALEV
jgi:hypothetical protein